MRFARSGAGSGLSRIAAASPGFAVWCDLGATRADEVLALVGGEVLAVGGAGEVFADEPG